MGEDVTIWIECIDTESDDDTTDSEEEWHQVKDQEHDSIHGAVRI